MTHEKKTQKQTWGRIQKGLALGLAFLGLLVFSISTQAQTFKFSKPQKLMSDKTKVVSPSSSTSRRSIAKPSKGNRSSVSTKPSTFGSRTSRSSSTASSSTAGKGNGGNSSGINSVGISNPRVVNLGNRRGSGQSNSHGGPPRFSTPPRSLPDFYGGGSGYRPPFQLPRDGITAPSRPDSNSGNGGVRITIPGIGGPQRDFPSRISTPIITLPNNGDRRIGRIPTPDLGRFLPDRNGGKPNVVTPAPFPSITESNQNFNNILGRISKLEPKPLDIKDIGKELNKLTLKTKDKPELNMKRQEMVLGARKTMGLRFGIGAGCHWWADLLCGWHWHRHGCHWTDLCAAPGYWSCWRPCHYRVVWCPTVHGHVRTAWYFGVESFLIPDLHALGVHEVSPYSPAAMAGLQPGDMILSVNGYALDNESILPEMIQTSGGVLNLEVYREGLEAPMAVQVRLRRLRITSH